MSLPLVRLLIATAALLPSIGMADQWVTVLHDGAREVQIDRGGVMQSDAGTRVAWARMVLSPPEAEKPGYTTVLALNRYDCRNRSFSTVRRRYLDARNIIQSEEEVRDQVARAVAHGGVDDRLWREVCSPPSTGDLVKLAEAAEQVAATLPQATAQPVASATLPSPAVAPKPAARPATPAPMISERKPSAITPPPSPGVKPRPVPAAAPVSQQPPYGPRHPGIAWSYEGITGPEMWGRLRPDWELCAKGQRQSPIELRDAMPVALEPIEFDYRESFFRVLDTGQLLRIYVGEGLGARIRGDRYELTHIDLHRPGEGHVDGRSFDLSAELHHRAGDGRMAVVSVQFQAGARAHPVLQSLLGSLPLERGDQYEPRFAIDLASLLPSERAYFLYAGSLTTPPCTEGVTRVVMKAPLNMSWDQLSVLARLHAPNARPLQPANGRILLESR